MQKVKEDMKSVQERKNQADNNLDRKIKKLEQNVIQEIESEKMARTEYTENWIKKSDEKILEICNSMEDITSQKGESIQLISSRIKKKIQEME